MEKYNIKEDEKEEKKPIEKFFTKAIRNAKFFPYNKKYSNILDRLINYKYIPLDDKVFYRLQNFFNTNP